MDTALLKTFLVLAKNKNFSRAGEKLHLSQSAVSLQLARLEALLGKQLFIRDKRHVDLTLEGEQLLGYAQQFSKLETEMINHFQKPPLQGDVTFGTPEDLATAYLPKILGDFTQAYPGIVLNFHCQFTEDLIKGFDSKLYDLVLIKQDPEHRHPKSEEVWVEPLVWVCAKDSIHFDWRERPLSLILAPSPCVYRRRAIDGLNQAGIPWRIVYTSPSLTGTLAAIKAGLGISILPLNMIPKEFLIIKNLPKIKDAQIALLKQDHISDAAKELGGYLLQALSEQERM